MAFFSITSTMLAENGANVLFVFRPDDASITTVEQFGDVLAEDGCVSGTRWKFKGYHQRLFDARKVLLGRSGVVLASKFVHECTEEAPEPDNE